MIKPTIKDVAALAGVSTTTVSHVINNTRFVSEEVRSRVTSAMNQTGYLPNSIARSLRKGVTNTIGMILPDSSNPFFAELGHAIEDLAFSQGYSVILCNTEGDPVKELFYINLLHQKQDDGMIFVATGDNPTTVNFFINNPINVVLIDRQLKVVDDLKIPTVMVDNETGAFIATSHLIHLGHRRIACISGSSKLTPSYQREIGYKKALEKGGIIIDESLVTQGNFDPQSGYQSLYKLKENLQPPLY